MTDAMCALDEASKGNPAFAKLPVLGRMLLLLDLDDAHSSPPDSCITSGDGKINVFGITGLHNSSSRIILDWFKIRCIGWINYLW